MPHNIFYMSNSFILAYSTIYANPETCIVRVRIALRVYNLKFKSVGLGDTYWLG